VGSRGLQATLTVVRGQAVTEKFYKLPVEIAARNDLTPGSKLVWAVLANRIGENGFCWPGVRLLADDTGLTVNGILKCLRSLERKHLLRIERQGSGKVNHYRLADGSAQQSLAPNRVKRPTELDTGAQQSCAQALNRVELNKKEPLKRTNSLSVSSSLKELFEEARRLYPGDKRGLDTELDNLRRKHKDWREIIPALEPALDMQMARREKMKAAGEFLPNWKHLKTYINGRFWESKLG